MINQYELYDCASITALYFGHHRMENIIDGALDYDINTGILKLIYKNSLAYFMCFAYMHNLHQIVYDDSILLPIENNMDGVISDYTEGSIADWKLYMEEHLMSNFIPYNDSLNCPYFYNDESFQIYTPYDLDNPSLTDDVILDKVVSLYTEVGTRDFYNPDNPTFYHLSYYQSDVPWF